MTKAIEKINLMREDELKTYLSTKASYNEMERLFGDHADAVKLYAEVEADTSLAGDSLLVMLPGLMGSTLMDANNGVIWVNPLAFLRGRLNHLDLALDGKTDATEGVNIIAPNPLWLAYAKMILRLQHKYELYSFPYDWRRSTMDTALLLRDFIDERLASSPHSQVTLVGHSLGGLVSLDYLVSEETKAHAEQNVKRVITLGTPFRGALEAVSALADRGNPQMEAAKKLNKNNDPARMVRSFPSMYQILPAPADLYENWDPVPDADIWDPQTWKDDGHEINENHLSAAADHHRMLANADPQVPLINVIGIHYPTSVTLIGRVLDAMPKMVQEGEEGGDGTVAINSAIFSGAEIYYVHEEHVELVLEQTVISSIMEWMEGGKTEELAQKFENVTLGDTKFRDAEIMQTVDMDEVARKLEAGEELNNAELKALYTVI